jgi:hypothetical protein
MFIPLASYQTVVSDAGAHYRPRAYAGRNGDNSWSGYLVFFPVLGPDRAASTAAEVVSPMLEGIRAWALSLTTPYLHEALRRALALERSADVDARIAAITTADEAAAVAAVERADIHADIVDRLANVRDAIAEVECEQAQEVGAETRAAAAAAAATAAEARSDAARAAAEARRTQATAADAPRRRRSRKKR